MLHTIDSITINAPTAKVYALAAEIEQWPALLPHYRYVRKISTGGAMTPGTYAMGALRSGIPVRWTAHQFLSSDSTQIRYHHVRGVTRGMDVEWRIAATGAGVEVTIAHVLSSGRGWPGVSGRVGRLLVGELFVRHIAQQTLHGIKVAAERTP